MEVIAHCREQVSDQFYLAWRPKQMDPWSKAMISERLWTLEGHQV